MLNLLAIGDITEPRAVPFLLGHLRRFTRENKVDFIIVNAENAGFIMGPTPALAEELLSGGIDCLTGGNHTLQNKLLMPMLESDPRLLRPLNYPPETPGSGAYIARVSGVRLLVLNAMGQSFIDPVLDSPFASVRRTLDRLSGEYDIAVLDFHAEATGEKIALALYFDGELSAVFGTHTHVPTADETVLPKGTGFVTDLGMCGTRHTVLGVAPESMIRRYVTKLGGRAELPEGPLFATGALFTIDEATKKCVAVRRVRFEESSVPK